MRIDAVKIVVAICMLTCAAMGQTTPSERRPVPRSGEQTRALNAIRQQFKSEYARHDAGEQLQLAQEFRKQAAQVAESDPVRQYVFLREARTLALGAGNFDIAFAAIDDMAKAFTIDATELKTTALTETLDRARIPPATLLNAYLKVTEDALSDGEVNLAYQAIQMAYRVVKPMHDPVATERVKEMDLRVHDARREVSAVIAAANKLQRQPDDPAANLIVGRFLCFGQGRWNEGLPLLARGSDKKLADLADSENAELVDANAMFDLAGTWWNIPDTHQTPARRSHERAAYWYEKALPRLSDAKKAIAQQRIEQARRETETHGR